MRITAMDGVDLDAFRFDFDMTWACVFQHADGTVLGRYGTRDTGVSGSESRISTAGLSRAMRRALEIHAAYPGNRETLAGKQPRPLGYARAEAIPSPRRQGMGSCIHCHHVEEALLRDRLARGLHLDERALFPYPVADRVGISLDPERGLVVASVAPDSPAARAGVEPGDELRSLAGQPLVSHADIQWILHHTPEEASLPLRLVRKGREEEGTLELCGPWRRSDPSWRESRWAIRPGFAMVRVESARRQALGLPADGMALEVTRVFGNAVRRDGVRRGDVIVAFGTERRDFTESEALLYLRGPDRPESPVVAEVRRGAERLSIPIALE